MKASTIAVVLLLGACSSGGNVGADLAVSQDLLIEDTFSFSACSLDAATMPCSSSDDSCALYGARCVASVCQCVAAVCTQGQDQTCNDDPSISTLLGRCDDAGACQCGASNVRNANTGKCAPPCPSTQPGEGSACASNGEGCEYGSQLECDCGATYKWTCDFGP